MNKLAMSAFSDEMQKQALVPRAVTKLFSKLKMRHAGVAADKAYIRQATNEVKKMKRLDPDIDSGVEFDKVYSKLRDEGSAKLKTMQEGPKACIGGESFLTNHKKKLLIGGAGLGGLYLASNSGNDQPQGVYR